MSRNLKSTLNSFISRFVKDVGCLRSVFTTIFADYMYNYDVDIQHHSVVYIRASTCTSLSGPMGVRRRVGISRLPGNHQRNDWGCIQPEASNRGIRRRARNDARTYYDKGRLYKNGGVCQWRHGESMQSAQKNSGYVVFADKHACVVTVVASTIFLHVYPFIDTRMSLRKTTICFPSAFYRAAHRHD